MSSHSDMQQLSLVVMQEDLLKVNETIIRHGCLHPFHAEQIGDWTARLSGFYDTVQLQEFKDARLRIASIAQRVNMPLHFDNTTFEQMKPDLEKLKFQTVAQAIYDFDNQLKSINDRLRGVDSKLAAEQEINNQFATFRNVLDLTQVSQYSLLDQFVGRIPAVKRAELSEKMKKFPHMLVPVKETPPWSVIIMYVLKKDRITVQKLLNEVSFQAVSLPPELKGPPEQVFEKLQKSHQKLHEEKEFYGKKQSELEDSIRKELPKYAYYVHFHTLLLESQHFFKKTERTCLITGWVPSETLAPLISDIKKITDGRCCFETADPEPKPDTAKSVPFRFKNISPLKPFELLIKLYGIPEYNTIDPTPIFALSMVFMFGFMFGDVGHGLVLALLGLWLVRKTGASIAIRQAGLLLTWCGGSSMVFGVLFGSIFGFENLFPALWLHPMHNITTLLNIALFFGIGLITIGIIINVINGIRTRKWSLAIFDKAGLVGGLLYWGIIGLVIRSYVFKHDIQTWMWLLFIGGPVVLLFLKAPFERLTGAHSHHEGGIFAYIMDMAFELVETLMGYVSNTFSFIRVGAFALSHVGLFMAIFTLADMVRGGNLGTFKSTIVIILGNILILCLEGLIVSIQTIRLEYYEFFSKFFAGDGLLYRPISISDETT